MTALVQIVADVGSTVPLLDLNGRAGGVVLGKRDGIDLAALQGGDRSSGAEFVWSPSANGADPLSLQSRQITLPVVVIGATPDAAAVLAARLREVTASRFVLRVVRHGSSVPVWIRCGPGQVSLSSNIASAGQPTRIVTGQLTAGTEPHALGARVDVGPVTITQDPSTGTPFIWDITVAAGDSLTPLVLRCADTDLTGQVDRTLITIRRRGTPSSLAGLVVQGEAATTSTGTTPPTLSTVTGDSALSGGSGLRATYTTGASGTWTAILPFSSLAGAEAPGVYRLLARVRRAGGASGALFSLAATVGRQRQVETFTASGNDTRIIDLGLVQVPIGQPPFLSAPQSPRSATAGTVALTVIRAQPGTGTVDLDWVGLFPADADTGVLEVASAASGTLALDGWDHTPRMFSSDPFTGSTPSATGAPGLSFVGGVPRLRPGANRLYVVAGLGAPGAARAPGLAIDLSASYWPRYGWLG